MPATIRIARRSKFNVSLDDRTTRIYRGVTYDSAAEAGFAAMLDARKRCGEIQDWWRQVEFPIKVNGQHICKMVVDFKVLNRDDSTVFYEVKGMETAVYKLKLKLLKACYPNVRLEVVKAR